MNRFVHSVLVWLAVGLFLLPIIWMFGTAFKPPGEILRSGASLLPSQLSIEAFKALWQGDFQILIGNTVLIALSATMVSVIVAFFAAYALVRYQFPAKLDNVFLLLVLVIKMMPPIVVAIPLYSLMNQLGLLNSKLGLILAYQVYTLPFCIWMLLGLSAIFRWKSRRLEQWMVPICLTA